MIFFKNKKGDMPWWFTRVIIPLIILIFVSYIIYTAVKKGMIPNIANIFARW